MNAKLFVVVLLFASSVYGRNIVELPSQQTGEDAWLMVTVEKEGFDNNWFSARTLNNYWVQIQGDSFYVPFETPVFQMLDRSLNKFQISTHDIGFELNQGANQVQLTVFSNILPDLTNQQIGYQSFRYIQGTQGMERTTLSPVYSQVPEPEALGLIAAVGIPMIYVLGQNRGIKPEDRWDRIKREA